MTKRFAAIALIFSSFFNTGCSFLNSSQPDIPLSLIDVPENVDLVVAIKNNDFIKQKFEEIKKIDGQNSDVAKLNIDDFEYGIIIADVTNYSPTGLLDVRNYCVKAIYKDSKELVNVPIPAAPNGNEFCKFEDQEFETQLQEVLANNNYNIFVHASTSKIHDLIATQYNSYKPLLEGQFREQLNSTSAEELEKFQQSVIYFGITTPIDAEDFLDKMIAGVRSINGLELITNLDAFEIGISIEQDQITWHNYYKLREGADAAKLAEILTHAEKAREITLTNTTDYQVLSKVDGQEFAIQSQLKNYDLSTALYSYASPSVSIGFLGLIAASASLPTFMGSPASSSNDVLSSIGLLDGQAQARDAQRKASIAMISQAIEAYSVDVGEYPANRVCAQELTDLKIYFPNGEIPTAPNNQAPKIDGCDYLYDPINSEDQNYAIYTTVESRENGNTQEMPTPGELPKISRVGGSYYVMIQ